MKIAERTSRCFNATLPATRLRATATRLTTLLVDLLLAGFSLFIRDEAPGIAIDTYQQSAGALASRRFASGLQSDLQQEGMASKEPDASLDLRGPYPTEMHPHEGLHGRL